MSQFIIGLIQRLLLGDMAYGEIQNIIVYFSMFYLCLL